MLANMKDTAAADNYLSSSCHCATIPLMLGRPFWGGRSGEGEVRVSIDGRPPGDARGVDVDREGNGTVREPRMYQLVRQLLPSLIGSSKSSFSTQALKLSRSPSVDRSNAVEVANGSANHFQLGFIRVGR